MNTELDIDKIVWYECHRAARRLDSSLSMNMYQAEDFHSFASIAAHKALLKHDETKIELRKYIHIRVRSTIIDYIRQLLPVKRRHMENYKKRTANIPKRLDIAAASEVEAKVDTDIQQLEVDDFIEASLHEFSERDKSIFRAIAMERRSATSISGDLQMHPVNIYRVYEKARAHLRDQLMILT